MGIGSECCRLAIHHAMPAQLLNPLPIVLQHQAKPDLVNTRIELIRHAAGDFAVIRQRCATTQRKQNKQHECP